MLILFGIWVAVAGGVAALAGLAGRHRVRRLRRDGVTAWALAVPEPVPAGQPPPDPPVRPMLQFTLADGRVVERIGPVPRRRTGSPRPGDKVLIWYDPADPDDVLVYGRWGRTADRVFLATGLLFIAAGIAIAAAAH
ncbi:MAG TPA: DUF3592 domain-containing protein [Streptosporangiaceae bacterium]|nr:DUF3592 domain-containing protein [Streptosporangiaceae bacterium]